MGHAALTSAATHRFAERFARGGVGQAGVETQPFKAWIDSWQMRSLAPDTGATLAPLELTASAKDFSYALKLQTDRPVVLQGDAGYSRKSERGQASYYYSQPYLRVSGAIMLDGKSIAVTGQGWIDREWSSQPLASDQTGWDWFSLHLDAGEKLMLFRLRHADGKHFFAGNWIGLDGRSVPLDASDIVLTPTTSTRIAGRDVPTAWKISVPSRKLEISSTPLNPQSWMDTRFKYWEGPVTVTGSHTGIGYLEMTGY
jgi:predicted secreted hydrolase